MVPEPQRFGPFRPVRVGGDGVDLNSELTLAALRDAAQQMQVLPRDEQLATITATMGVLLNLAEEIWPQYRELVDFMGTHDAGSVDHDDPRAMRVAGLARWAFQLAPAEIVSIVSATGALIELVRLTGFDAPPEVLELFADESEG